MIWIIVGIALYIAVGVGLLGFFWYEMGYEDAAVRAAPYHPVKVVGWAIALVAFWIVGLLVLAAVGAVHWLADRLEKRRERRG